MLGNGRLEALCFDGEKRLAHIRGKLRKKVWINQGDIILLSLRDYQDEKGDVILKYSADEARSLKAYGELPESAKINETDTYVGLGLGILGCLPVVTDAMCAAGTDMKVWMTMWSSTRIGMGAVMIRRLMWMRSRLQAWAYNSVESILWSCSSYGSYSLVYEMSASIFGLHAAFTMKPFFALVGAGVKRGLSIFVCTFLGASGTVGKKNIWLSLNKIHCVCFHFEDKNAMDGCEY